jgi:hypothetical protein
MNWRLFGCGKFRWLAIERYDRELNQGEESFYRKHREVCFECLRYEQQGVNAMNLLIAASVEPEVSANFDEKVIRELRRTTVPRTSFAYWTPMVAGAAVAGLAIVAALQLLTGPNVKLVPNNGNSALNKFHNSDPATMPILELPEFNR